QFVADIIIGNRLAPNPNDGDGQDQQEKKDEQTELGQPPCPVPTPAVVDIGVLDQPFMLKGSFDTLYRTIVISGAHPGSKPLYAATVPYPHRCGVAWETRFA